MDRMATTHSPTVSSPEKAKAVLIVLVGIPGSGKSTLAERIREYCAEELGSSFERINQDSIAGAGKRGTKKQCVAALERELLDSQAKTMDAKQGDKDKRMVVVVVDRTNLTPDQRAVFVDMAKRYGVERRICVVLDVKATVCAYRAAQRSGHEGGLQGKGAYGVTHMAAKRLVYDADVLKKEEGFTHVFVIKNQNDGDDGVFSVSSLFDESDSGLQNSKITSPFKTTHAESLLEANDDGDESKPCEHANKKKKKSTKMNALEILMSSAARKQTEPKGAVVDKKQRGSTSKHVFPPYTHILRTYARRPDTIPRQQQQQEDNILHLDDECIAIRDKYPKARFHILVIARDPDLLGPLDLKWPKHVALLRHMRDIAQNIANKQGFTDVQMGFHSCPSLAQLHMHCISRDFDSPHLKTKVHWNSFTLIPEFFLPAEDLINNTTSEFLSYSIDEKKALLKHTPVRCLKYPQCGFELKSRQGMTAFKEHLSQCLPR